MTYQRRFKLPDSGLTSLPTGAAKDVANSLGFSIANGQYAPLETLPMEDDLSREHNVSRTVIREAVKVLSGKGMVRTARRYGTRICPFEEWHLLDPDVIRWHGPSSPMAPRIHRDATALRCVIEPEGARLAAEQATAEQIETLIQSAKSIRPEPHGRTAMLAADYTFHSTILSASGNIMLEQLNGLLLALIPFSYASDSIHAPEFQISWEQHLEVALAISDGSGTRAAALMSDMLEQYRGVAHHLEFGGAQPK